MEVFASANSNKDTRRASSSGGAFSILAEQVLDSGGTVYGAAFNTRWEIAHRRVDTNQDLSLLRSSKYAYSIIGDSIRKAMQDLERGEGRKVLFSGTPCQVAAMRKRAGDHPNLLLVEVVCHGAPEQKYWTRYVNELCASHKRSPEDIASINFRDKATGWKNYSFTIVYKDGKRFSQPHDDNLYMRAFLKDLTLREACFRCPFKHPASHADIILGDLWGATQLAPDLDDDSGLSLIIIRTEKGKAAASHLKRTCPLTLEDVTRYNPALTSCPTPPAARMDFINHLDTGHNLLASFRKHAARSTWETLYLKTARLKHQILKFTR